MQQVQTEAIVLSVRDWGDADRLVILFTREFGKIAAVAYGARRTKNRLAGVIQPFCYVDTSLSLGSTIDIIRQASVRNSFRPMREDFTLIAYGSLVAEAAVELFPEHDPAPEVLELLLKVLNVMPRRNPRITAMAAVWQLLALAGFQPQLHHCVSCGKVLEYPARFSAGLGGASCFNCGEGEPLEEKTTAFLTTMMNLDWDNPASFTITGACLMQAERCLSQYLLFCLDKPLKSLVFIRQVSGTPPTGDNV